MKEKAIFSWSGGKDSALALYELTKRADYEIAALLTTLNQDYDRTSMHGVRRILLEQQAQSLGFALEKVLISKKTSNEEYERKMQEVLEKYQADGVCSVVFGDIFLEDLRKYREENLSKIGMKGIFPIWKFNTSELNNTFIDSGFKAVIT
ncbi:MAG: Dph6-related ATP pyrophosphatase, partial [Planctomycetota bacterium]